MSIQTLNNSIIKKSEKEVLFRKGFVLVLDIISYNEFLESDKKHLLAEKILKAGTSFGSYLNEIKNCTNSNYCQKKLASAKKEAQKIKYLLQLCKYSSSYPNPNNLISDIEEIIDTFIQLSN